MLDDLGASEQAIPILNVSDICHILQWPIHHLQVTRDVLEKVMQWCSHHRDDTSGIPDNDSHYKTNEIGEWDQSFMQIDQGMLFEIILVGGSFIFPKAYVLIDS